VPLRVHTYHGHLLKGYFGPVVVWIIRVVESFLARHTSALVAVGARVRDDLLGVGIGRADQYTVISPGVEPGGISPGREGQESWALAEGAPVILFVGRLTRIKRFDRLIEAMDIVLQEVPDAVLVVIGEGDELEEARRLSKPLGASILFLGWRSELGPAYAAADVVVLTSDSEGMPVSLIEAAMAGRPCVTTDVGSAGEVVTHGETGYVVPPDPESIARALLTLLGDDDLRRRMGDTARRLAERHHSVRRFVSDHELLYRRLVEG
jgi:glycosyltransferase involved in cell wall biosynthesis